MSSSAATLEQPGDMTTEAYRRTVFIIALDEAGQVETLTNELYTVTAQQTRIRETLAGREAAIVSDMSTEIGNDDKPKYSNTEVRKAEALIRFQNDAIAVALRNEVIDGDIAIAMKRERIACINQSIKIRTAFLNGS